MAYDLTEKDYELVEVIDNKVFDLLDSHENIKPEQIITVLKNFEEKKVQSERISNILLTVIDDVEYEYYLWEYSEWVAVTMNASDCYEWEEFDEEEGVCYSTWDEWDGVDYYEDYWDDEMSHDEGEHEESSTEWAEEVRGSYKINGDIITLVSGKKHNEDEKVFSMFTTLIPESARKDFKLFNVVNDQEWDTAAHVVQDNDEPNKWNMTVNIASFYIDWKIDMKESLHTLIHEYSHVLSLGKTQVKYPASNWVEKENDSAYETARKICREYFVWEGCLRSKAYLNSFIEKFWKKDFATSQNWKENDFYTGKENNFVSDYAATNPWEDIAESFTNFVLKSKTTWNTIADQKMLFFYSYPELVKLRNIIRSRLSQIK